MGGVHPEGGYLRGADQERAGAAEVETARDELCAWCERWLRPQPVERLLAARSYGATGRTPDEAEVKFRGGWAETMRETGGFYGWRVTPTLHERMDGNSGETFYVVRARAWFLAGGEGAAE